MANQSTIQIIIDGDNIKAVNAISGVETKLKKLDSQSRQSGGILDNVLGMVTKHWGAFSVGAAAVGLEQLIENAIDLGDKFHDMSMKTGLAVETLSLLDYAAKMNGTDIDTVSNLIVKFSKNVYEAANGTGKATNEFKMLGINLTEPTGKLRDLELLLMETTKKFSAMPDGIEKTAIAQKLFSKSGAESIAMLNDLGKNGEEYKKFLKDTGAFITTEFANAADRFKDSLTTVKTALSGIGIKLADEFLPSLTAASIALVQISSDSKNTIPLIVLLGDSIKSVATVLGGVAVGAIVAGEALGTYWAAMAKAATLHFGDAAEVIKLGFAQINRTALDAGKLFDAMWSPDKFKTQIDALNKLNKAQTDLELKNAKAEASAKKLKDISDQIDFENAKLGLDETQIKLLELQEQVRKWQAEGADKSKTQNYLIKQSDIALAAAYEKQMKKLWDDADKRADLASMLNLKISPDALNEADDKLIKLQEDAIKWRKILGDDSPLVDQVVLSESERIIREFYAKKEEMRQKDEDSEAEAQANIARMEEELYRERMQMTADAFGSMADTMMSSFQAAGGASETWFDAYKTMKIAETLIATYSSAEKSYDWAAAWGGPIAGAIAAAVAVSAGLARVGQITAVGRGSLGGGGGSSYSAPANPVLPSSITNLNNNTNNNATNQNIVINFTGSYPTDNWWRDNAGALQKLFKDNVIVIKPN